MTKRIILLAGPTGSGKSTVAMSLAEKLGGVIINADSMQLYSELRLLTARPSVHDEKAVPHRLYGEWPAAERCSAGRWLPRAIEEIEAAITAGKTAIVVGGTGLYFRVLLQGLADIPDIPPDILADVDRHWAQVGGDEFLAELAAVDQPLAARLAPADRQRAVRGLSVFRATGRPLSQWQQEPVQGFLADFEVEGQLFKFALAPDRAELYARCNQRLEAMLADGALEEVEHLLTLGLASDLPAMKALGVPEFAAYLAQDDRSPADLKVALSAAQQATRRYAKRQMTWQRNQMADWVLLDTKYLERLNEKIISIISKNMLTT